MNAQLNSIFTISDFPYLFIKQYNHIFIFLFSWSSTSSKLPSTYKIIFHEKISILSTIICARSSSTSRNAIGHTSIILFTSCPSSSGFKTLILSVNLSLSCCFISYSYLDEAAFLFWLAPSPIPGILRLI